MNTYLNDFHEPIFTPLQTPSNGFSYFHASNKLKFTSPLHDLHRHASCPSPRLLLRYHISAVTQVYPTNSPQDLIDNFLNPSRFLSLFKLLNSSVPQKPLFLPSPPLPSIYPHKPWIPPTLACPTLIRPSRIPIPTLSLHPSPAKETIPSRHTSHLPFLWHEAPRS